MRRISFYTHVTHKRAQKRTTHTHTHTHTHRHASVSGTCSPANSSGGARTHAHTRTHTHTHTYTHTHTFPTRLPPSSLVDAQSALSTHTVTFQSVPSERTLRFTSPTLTCERRLDPILSALAPCLEVFTVLDLLFGSFTHNCKKRLTTLTAGLSASTACARIGSIDVHLAVDSRMQKTQLNLICCTEVNRPGHNKSGWTSASSRRSG